MDENRLFANSSKYVANMGALVRRDRNHPSVVMWSVANEPDSEHASARRDLPRELARGPELPSCCWAPPSRVAARPLRC